jgi:hypothetical protein
MSISGEVPVVYRGEEVDDDVPRDERDLMVSAAFTNACSSDDEKRLEAGLGADELRPWMAT